MKKWIYFFCTVLLLPLAVFSQSHRDRDSSKYRNISRHFDQKRIDSINKKSKWDKYYLDVDTADNIKVNDNSAPKAIVLKTSVISWLANPASARLALEIPFAKYKSVQIEAGYIYAFTQDGARLDKSAPNVELRLSGRYYFPQKLLYGIYAEPLVGIRNIQTQWGNWVGTPNPGRNDSTFNLDYSHATKYQQTDYMIGCQAGIQPVIWKRLVLDIAGGLVFDLEHDKGISDPATMSYINTTRFLPRGLLTVRLGYVFGNIK